MTIRGKRSELISFYCPECNCIYIDYLLKNIIIVGKEILCKECYTKVIKELTNHN